MSSLYFRSIAVFLGVFFLFSSIAIGFQITARQSSNAPKTEVHNHGVSPLHAGNQLPFEEKEEQREKDHQTLTFSLSYTAFDFKPILSERIENCDHYNASRVLARLGLYLLIRHLLI